MKSKKIICLLFIVQWIVCFLMVPAFAESQEECDLSYAVGVISPAAPSDGSRIVVSSGDQITVEISVSRNQGFLMSIADVLYDAEAVSYQGASMESSAFPSEQLTVGDKNAGQGNIKLTLGNLNTLFDPNAEPFHASGRVVLLQFQVADGYEGEIDIQVSVKSANVIDLNRKTGQYTVGGDTQTLQVIHWDTHEHINGDWVVDKEPTCTENGHRYQKCTTCGTVVESEELEELGHDLLHHEAKEATCTESGLTEGKHCSVCNEVIVKQEVVPAKGHTEVVDKAKDATCTESGLTEGKHCSVCNAVIVKQEVVPAKGHTEVIDKAKDATCTETGLTEGKHCSACNAVIVEQKVIPAKGHIEVVDKAKDATCTESGLTEGKHCSVCDTVLVAQNTVPAQGHTEIVDKEIQPTYSETGLTEGTHCSICGEVLKAQEVIAKKSLTWLWGTILTVIVVAGSGGLAYFLLTRRKH